MTGKNFSKNWSSITRTAEFGINGTNINTQHFMIHLRVSTKTGAGKAEKHSALALCQFCTALGRNKLSMSRRQSRAIMEDVFTT